MATLATKETVLRLLDPQPADGMGPGYISALDMKTVCGNLYDAISSVNGSVDAIPDQYQIADLSAYFTTSTIQRRRLVRLLVDSDFNTRTLTLAELSEVVLYALIVDAGKTDVLPGASLPDETVADAYVVNSRFYSTIPVAWGPNVATIGTELYWWNGACFKRVTVAPTGQPNPLSIVPNDTFTAFTPVVGGPALLSAGLIGNDAAWTAAGTGAKFTVVEFTNDSPVTYYWVPPAAGVPGHFLQGTKG